jgi:hypothetical protein
LRTLAPTLVSKKVDGRHRSVVKTNAESLSQHDEKHVVPTPLSRIRVGKRRVKVENQLEDIYSFVQPDLLLSLEISVIFYEIRALHSPKCIV